MAKSSVLKQYALIGAVARVREITVELAEIARSFPGLTRRGTNRAAATASDEPAAPRRRRRPMSAAQKRAVGIRMKAYWAARRKGKAAVRT